MSGPLRRAALVLALVALIAACTACGGADQEQLRTQRVPGADVTVAIVDSPESVGTFQPHTVRIGPGQTVGWINAGGDYHTVTFEQPGAPPSSHGFGHGATFRATFPHPGTFAYRCAYHNGMTGEVIVGTASPTPPS